MHAFLSKCFSSATQPELLTLLQRKQRASVKHIELPYRSKKCQKAAFCRQGLAQHYGVLALLIDTPYTPFHTNTAYESQKQSRCKLLSMGMLFYLETSMLASGLLGTSSSTSWRIPKPWAKPCHGSCSEAGKLASSPNPVSLGPGCNPMACCTSGKRALFLKPPSISLPPIPLYSVLSRRSSAVLPHFKNEVTARHSDQMSTCSHTTFHGNLFQWLQCWYEGNEFPQAVKYLRMRLIPWKIM